MDSIDKGNRCPEMPGDIGRYLRQYKSSRNDFVKIVTEDGIKIAKNGRLLGNQFGKIFINPLVGFWGEDSRWINNYHGMYRTFPVISNEILSVLDLRLWEESASGSSGNSMVDRIEDGEVLALEGGYQWLPPNRINPGVGKFTYSTGESQMISWNKVRFLKYVGEDILSDPHALDYRVLHFNGRRKLVSVRSVIGLNNNSGYISVPCAIQDITSSDIPIKLSDLTREDAQNVLKNEGLVQLLLVKEPDSADWVVWDALSASEDDLAENLIEWALHMEELTGSEIHGGEDAIVAQVHYRFTKLGLNWTGTYENNLQHTVPFDIARKFACQLRFYGSSTPSNVAGLVD